MKALGVLAVSVSLLAGGLPAHADNKAVAIDEMAGYLEFIDYGGGVIFAEQIPRDEYKDSRITKLREGIESIDKRINESLRKLDESVVNTLDEALKTQILIQQITPMHV